MSVIASDARQSGAGAEWPTLASTWWAISGGGFTDELLAWPPDVFALTKCAARSIGGVPIRVVAAGGGAVAARRQW
jgi:hypothetical protein